MKADHSAAVGGLPPGTRLGRYRVLQRLALGGMAELYLARQEAAAGFTKVVALKRVLPHLAEDAEFVGMFLNEAKLASCLEHPNIASVTDFGQSGRDYFMVLEFVHGRGVNELLRSAAKGSGVPLDCALTICVAVASALHHAHQATDDAGAPLGLVHRDVSPSNILVSYDGGVKLVDFGIAKATSQSEGTRSQALKGKIPYMSPEQARGARIDRTTDVYALGVVLYELTTGRRCFFAEGEFALLNKVADGRYAAPHKVTPGYPPALEAIVTRALQVDAAERYASTREFQTALEGFAAEHGLRLSTAALGDFVTGLFGEAPHPSTTLTPLPATETTGRSVLATPKGRRRVGWIGGAALGIAVGGAIGAAVMRSQSPEPTPELEREAPIQSEPPVEAAVAEPPPPVDDPPAADSENVELVPEADPPEAADPPSKSPRKKRKKRRKPKSDAKPSGGPSVPSEFLPPSHRE